MVDHYLICCLTCEGHAMMQPSDHKDTRCAVPSKLLVTWTAGEAENPRNWTRQYKWWLTIQLGLLALTASLGSSIIAPSEQAISVLTGVSNEVSVLCISLYILGFALGPLLWAPISEIWGRRWGMLPAMAGLGLFSIGTATSSNIQSILVTRCIAGIFGSAPVSNVSAALGDIWAPDERGLAVAFYAGKCACPLVNTVTNEKCSRGCRRSNLGPCYWQCRDSYAWLALDGVYSGYLDIYNPLTVRLLPT